ncbi:unnamed protein product [Acanthoscelides obtectus]|uniref:RRM domain-containing protein n=1 Tax=Acanthoscelides obtectus TaxID=200917 RepID=A0A9P0K3J6_ACAOB|nr:unnamed protein product [Acanthoscelides obtectus]CAK1652334.1 Probable RNA-binding protein 19 [Acanthoscelides obtectus]
MMSRLIVKNLPKTVTEDSLRKLFGEKGTVTDVQLKFTPDGKFRKFAFVGYQTDAEADEAIKTLNKSFINTSRITVEACSTLGDENKPKAWSKYAPDNVSTKTVDETDGRTTDKAAKKKKNKEKKEKDETVELLEKYKDDPLFEEFLQVHAPDETEKLHKIRQQKSEKEDSGQGSASDLEEDNDEAVKLANEEISDLEYMNQLMKGKGERKPRQKMEKKVKEKVKLFTVKLRDLPYNVKKKDIKQFFKPLTCFSIRIPRNVHGFAYVGFKTEKLFKKALIKDRSFINGKRVSVVKYEHNDNVDDSAKDNKVKNKWKNQEESLQNEEDIAESGKIFFRNLAYTTTEDDLEKLFSKYGPLAEISVPVDKTTKKLKGFGTVTFLMPEHAVKAYSELDGSVLHGRMLHLLPAKSKDTAEDNIEDSSNFKTKKAAKQKAQAGSTHNWNSLFLGHDAVAEVVADAYGTTKEAVVGPDVHGSAAVRLALGETQIVTETRKYLEAHGVVLDAFANAGPRSKTLILVKNLPSKTGQKEIREVFEKHGYVGRVILPPSGITALVEFLEPSEAKKAFTRLAYSKFKNAPLYLEWAPENSLIEKVQQSEKENDHDKRIVQEEVEAQSGDAEEDEEEPEPDTTLFVKNLNFKTTDEDLRKHFEGCGKIHYANLATKKDKSDPKNKLSMGYGFVRYVHKQSADKALKKLQQSVLDGKSLELKRSERTLKDEAHVAKKTVKKMKQTGTKILVRNVPFQASRKEIQELFSTFGEIKALRLPKKMGAGTDSHRGFAFVDFSTNSDAKAAFESLSQSTHLYGRRLVLEWAANEEGVEDIRKRTADHFNPTEEVKSKKSVFTID